MNVAYDPVLDVYYTGGGGYNVNSATVNNPDGTILHATNVAADLRSWFYNPNTGNLELMSYSANSGDGVNYGFFTMGRSGSNLDGSKTLIRASSPGLTDEQTMPAYDSDADELYSCSAGLTSVRKLRRSDGGLISTINCTGAPGSNDSYSVGYDSDENWIMLYSSSPSRVMVFDGTSGAYIGSAACDISMQNFYGFGYSNKQVWLYDQNRNGWQGYDIGAGGGGGFDLTIDMPGGCPGAITVSWTGSPGTGLQALVIGNSLGSTTIPGTYPCPGTVLGVQGGVQLVDPPGYFNNQGGAGSISGNVNSGAVCGKYLQLVKGGTCETSDVEQIN
jgi:hypothetical protein